VRKCIDKLTGQQYAMKIIDKKKVMLINSSGRLDNLMDEVNILRAANHVGIIKMYDVIETPKTLYVVLELVSGGDLFDRIVAQEGKGFTEEVARQMFSQMLAAVKYLHGQSIVHRVSCPAYLTSRARKKRSSLIRLLTSRCRALISACPGSEAGEHSHANKGR
jgi:serine/threonine-protein kinase Chk2